MRWRIFHKSQMGLLDVTNSLLSAKPQTGEGESGKAIGGAGTGILPAQALRALIKSGEVAADAGIEDDQVQPASLDLRLGSVAYRLRASFLPGLGAGVTGKMSDLVMHKIDLGAGAVLEVGCVYLVPLQERLTLTSRIAGRANPKSSTGRLDVFTRLICDGATEFDTVPAGYSGPLYAEISPRTFSVLVRTGSKLNQLRLRRGTAAFPDTELQRLHLRETLVSSEGDADIQEGIACSVDLGGEPGSLIGYCAKRHAAVVDMDAEAAYDAHEFWDPVTIGASRRLILDPNEFYILVSKEAI
ncbi:MAG: 2'-deoxycytidine 5'-triphosphate deaminase, partial [Pseudomonadota bacterium]